MVIFLLLNSSGGELNCSSSTSEHRGKKSESHTMKTETPLRLCSDLTWSSNRRVCAHLCVHVYVCPQAYACVHACVPSCSVRPPAVESLPIT